jgi:hypothetical protein
VALRISLPALLPVRHCVQLLGGSLPFLLGYMGGELGPAPRYDIDNEDEADYDELMHWAAFGASRGAFVALQRAGRVVWPVPAHAGSSTGRAAGRGTGAPMVVAGGWNQPVRELGMLGYTTVMHMVA